jgi:insulysin
VLLIHDPETEKGAAAMDCRVGHMSDPADTQGIAHFLEHMLFMGTEKYPVCCSTYIHIYIPTIKLI